MGTTMLTVKTFLDRSRVHGIGLFADQFISKSSIVWEFNPSVDFAYDESAWRKLRNKLSPHSFYSIRKYSYKEKGQYILCVDNSQFMNHSNENANIIQDEEANSMRAMRDISVGEELLCNYFEYSDFDDFHRTELLRQREKNYI